MLDGVSSGCPGLARAMCPFALTGNLAGTSRLLHRLCALPTAPGHDVAIYLDSASLGGNGPPSQDATGLDPRIQSLALAWPNFLQPLLVEFSVLPGHAQSAATATGDAPAIAVEHCADVRLRFLELLPGGATDDPPGSYAEDTTGFRVEGIRKSAGGLILVVTRTGIAPTRSLPAAFR